MVHQTFGEMTKEKAAPLASPPTSENITRVVATSCSYCSTMLRKRHAFM